MGLQCGGGLPCEKEEINKWHICIFSDGCSFCTLAHFISCNHPWRSQNISEWIPDSAYWVEDSLSRISSTYLPMPPFFLSPIVREPRSRSPWLPRFLPWLHHHSGTVPTVPCPCLSSSRATGLGISQAHLVPPGRWWLSRLLSHHVPGFFSHSILGTVVCGSVSLSLLLRPFSWPGLAGLSVWNLQSSLPKPLWTGRLILAQQTPPLGGTDRAPVWCCAVGAWLLLLFSVPAGHPSACKAQGVVCLEPISPTPRIPQPCLEKPFLPNPVLWSHPGFWRLHTWL